MQLTDWLSSWWSARKPTRRRSRHGKPASESARQAKVAAEFLEQRMMPAVITVTSLADTVANDGQVTLREAIQAANSDTTVDGVTGSGADTIQFAPALTASGPATITLGGTELLIKSDLSIQGPGANNLTIDGNQRSRIFNVNDSTSLKKLVIISGLTITNGKDSTGGGIQNMENLTVLQSVVSRNTISWGSCGGGIVNNSGGILTVDQSIIVDNGAIGGGSGGGIGNYYSTLTVLRSSITGNVGGAGGGIASYYDAGPLTISNTTISGNTASGSGGGVIAYGSSSAPQLIAITQSTISGNTTAGHGGGIIASGFSSMSISQCTIVGNSAANTATGGGLLVSNSANVTLTNSIVVGNRRSDGTDDDLGSSGALSASSKNNLIGDPNHAAGLINGIKGNIVGMSNGVGGRQTLNLANVLFPAPTNFGGLTAVIPLVTGSLALDAGANSVIPLDSLDLDSDANTTEAVPFDQNGSGFNRVVNGTVDIGTSEGVPSRVVVAVAASPAKVKEDGSENLSFQFTRSSTNGTLTVSFTVSGTATQDSDYTTSGFSDATGAVTFADGASVASITVDPAVDGTFEDNESVVLTIVNSPNYTVSTWNSAVGTIANDDTIVVDTLEDAVDGNRTPGNWSLREAILLANANVGPDVITFAPSLTASGQATIAHTMGLIRINDDLVIQGPTDREITISGNNTFQLFEVEDRTSADKVVAFRSLTLTGGKAEINGGAISNGENLTITDCTITGNSAVVEGGGVHNGNRARLTVEQSTFVGNSSNFRGGAISNRGNLTVRQSTIVNNSAGSSKGGGIFDYYNSAVLTNTIIAGNTKGAGVESDFEGSALTSASRNNLFGSPTTAGGLTHGVNGNIVGQANGTGRTRINLTSVLNPTPSNNGGPTKTLALVSGSPAIDAGDNSLIPADTLDRDVDGNTTEAVPFDQRGSGFARVANTVDIGAFEVPPVASPISISATSSVNSEGNGGSTAFSFTVSRIGVTTGAASVNYAITGFGTNPADAADFGGAFSNGTVNFAANETSKTLTFDVTGDSTAETDDSFVVRLSNPVGGYLDTAATNLVVNGDFEAANSSFSSAYRHRPNTLDSLHSAGDYTVTADPRFVHEQFASYPDHTLGSGTLMLVANGATTPITVWGQTVAVTPNTIYQFAAYGSTTVVDTATLRFEINGVDVGTLNVPATTGQWTPFTATWNSGSATTADLKIINLSVASNGNDFALDDIFFGQTTGTPVAIGIILNDDSNDASLSIAAANASRLEGANGGTTAFTFTVTRSGSTSGTASANFAVTGSGTNLANGSDFGGSLPSGVIRFEAGETAKTITINVSGDAIVEPNEGFTVMLANAVGASLGTTSASGLIRNDDASLSIAAVSADQSEGNSGTTPFTFTVTRTGTISGAASVNYAVTGSGANGADATDFGGTLPSGTINFAAGETLKAITFNVVSDSMSELDETFTVTLSNATGANLGTTTATGTILNDDVNVSLDATGNLWIRDLAVDGRADRLTVSFDADTQEIVIRDLQNTLNANIGTVVDAHEIRVTCAEITGNGLHVDLNGGADQLDLSGLPAGLLSAEVDGGDGNDTIIGHAGADLIVGGLGHDSILGGEGNDTLLGGKGNDVLNGEAGDDSLCGQTQNDRLIGGDGDDTCDGGSGDDNLSGDAGNDRLLGTTGNDVISGGDGRDRIFGGDGHDILEGNSGNDQINGGSGDDTADGGAGNDFVEGQAGNDLLNGSNGDDTLDGGFDDDTLLGLAGNDHLDGGDGNDLAKGGAGNDTLLGGIGNDNLSGSIGDDVEDGGEGADTLAGGDGNDSLSGGDGDDYLHGDNGLDDLHGNAGDDSLDGGAGQDVISVDLGSDILLGDDDDDILL